MSASLTVIKPGMLTTVQDLGRHGYQGLGVPVSGPMDLYSHRLANLVLGNDPMAAALEITLMGPELVADGAVTCAIAGAEIDATVDGHPVPPNTPFAVVSGGRIRFGQRRRGARLSLAVRGGFDVPVTLGSRATHLVSRMGPFGGRALKAGDVLPVGSVASAPSPPSAPSAASSAAPSYPSSAPSAAPSTAPSTAPSYPSPPSYPLRLELPEGGARLRVVPAVHRHRFTDDAWTVLLRERFVITPQSNRMGYRLGGPALRHVDSADILSEAMPLGALQVPASGQPILLLSGRATTGGYATIANVISADLPIAGQLAPGDWIAFDAVTHAQALDALRARESDLTGARI